MLFSPDYRITAVYRMALEDPEDADASLAVAEHLLSVLRFGCPPEHHNRLIAAVCARPSLPRYQLLYLASRVDTRCPHAVEAALVLYHHPQSNENVVAALVCAFGPEKLTSAVLEALLAAGSTVPLALQLVNHALLPTRRGYPEFRQVGEAAQELAERNLPPAVQRTACALAPTWTGTADDLLFTAAAIVA